MSRATSFKVAANNRASQGLVVGFKFCGNCNPTIDVEELVEGLKLRIEGIKLVPLGASEGKHVDKALFISGCPTDCANQSKLPDGVVKGMTVVAGSSINGVAVPPAELADRVAQALGGSLVGKPAKGPGGTIRATPRTQHSTAKPSDSG